MAIRNTSLGGSTNWTSEVLTSTDLNDTFTAVVTTLNTTSATLSNQIAYRYLGKTILESTSTSLSITSLSSIYSSFTLEIQITGTGDPANTNFRINNDSGANKYTFVSVTNGAAADVTTGANAFSIGGPIDSTAICLINMTIGNVALGGYKPISGISCSNKIGSNGTQRIANGAWVSTDAITKFEINPNASSFGIGSYIKVWGVKE